MTVLAGTKSSVLRALSLIESLGRPLGIYVNHEKCEVYSRNDITMLPSCIKSSNLPHFEILGAPIGDYLYCANFISSKRQQAARLLSRLEGVAGIDPRWYYCSYASVLVSAS